MCLLSFTIHDPTWHFGLCCLILESCHQTLQVMSSQRRPDRKASTSLDLCQEPARGIKHEVTGRQLPSCLLSAPCPCMRDAKAGAYTSAALLQLLKTYCTLKETHFSKTIFHQSPLKPAKSCGQESTHSKVQSLSLTTVNRAKKREREGKKGKISSYIQTAPCCDTILLIPLPKFPGYLLRQLEKYYPNRSLSGSCKHGFHTILVWKRHTENQLGLAARSRTNG